MRWVEWGAYYVFGFDARRPSYRRVLDVRRDITMTVVYLNVADLYSAVERSEVDEGLKWRLCLIVWINLAV